MKSSCRDRQRSPTDQPLMNPRKGNKYLMKVIGLIILSARAYGWHFYALLWFSHLLGIREVPGSSPSADDDFFHHALIYIYIFLSL